MCNNKDAFNLIEFYKPFSLLVMGASHMVKKHRINMPQAKLNNSIEYCKEKNFLSVKFMAVQCTTSLIDSS